MPETPIWLNIFYFLSVLFKYVILDIVWFSVYLSITKAIKLNYLYYLLSKRFSFYEWPYKKFCCSFFSLGYSFFIPWNRIVSKEWHSLILCESKQVPTKEGTAMNGWWINTIIRYLYCVFLTFMYKMYTGTVFFFYFLEYNIAENYVYQYFILENVKYRFTLQV